VIGEVPVVGSTPLVQRLGDAEWKRLIGSHDAVVRNEVEHYRGRVVSSTGDGVFARFDAAARGLMSALAIRDAADRLGLPIRTGLHTGEVELDGNGLRGIAIHEASRIMSLAAADEILVSELTVQLATGGGLTFEDRGEVELRGVSGKRRLYALTGRS
jgi:class 3 adenylate cyclase